MEDEKIELKKDLEKVRDWAALMIADRHTMVCPEQAVITLYPHMKLLEAAETILEWMTYPAGRPTIRVDLPKWDPLSPNDV